MSRLHSTALVASCCVVAAIALASCGSAGGASGAAVALAATADRPDTRVTVSADAQQAIVDVSSPSGIGGATVAITSAVQPQKITLRLHLRGLEELRFTYGDTTISASISSAGDTSIHQTYRGAGPERAIAEGSPYWMQTRLVPAGGAPATIPLQDGYIEVEAPQDFLASGQTTFAIQWVDFFR
jgi:hypothetical protein